MKNKKGISLIVLIITIIVVIILAAAVILTMNNNNPVSSAKEATFKNDVRSFQDELSMTISKEYVDNQGQRDTKITTSDNPSLSDMQVYIKSFTSKYVGKFKIVNDELVYIGDNETEKDWFNNMIGTTASSNNVPDDWKNSIKIVTEENVPIPKGFTYVEGTKDEGVVIEDEDNGNEFVWVPVSDSVPYTKWCTVGIDYNDSGISDVALPSGITDETADVVKYGGFYIGRYEAGVPDNQSTIDGNSDSTSNVTGKPTSKKGKASWTCINYTNSKTNAESMYNTSSVKSGLLTGTAWDTTCKLIQNSGKSVTDSTSYGNYYSSTFEYTNTAGETVTKASKSSVKILTGSTEYTKVNNIYDLAGNAMEWTAEALSSSNVPCGGYCSYVSDGDYGPVSYRSGYIASGTDFNMGFRVRLYIL